MPKADVLPIGWPNPLNVVAGLLCVVVWPNEVPVPNPPNPDVAWGAALLAGVPKPPNPLDAGAPNPEAGAGFEVPKPKLGCDGAGVLPKPMVC